MAEDSAKPTPWFKRFWDGLGHFGRARTLWQLAVSFYTTSTAVSTLPGGWHPPQDRAVAGLVFCGTWATAQTVVVVLQYLWAKFSRWRNPSKLVVDIHGGDKASLELRHSGSPATYSANGRILRMGDETPNPSPALFQAQLILKGHNESPGLLMRDGDWALIVIASIERADMVGVWLAMRRGEYGHNIRVSDLGGVTEIQIQSDAGYKSVHRVQVFRRRRRDDSTIVAGAVDA